MHRGLSASISVVFAFVGAVLTAPAQAQSATQTPSEARALVVGTSVAPPFSFRNEQGEWDGISIVLWRKLALRLDVETRFEERTVPELIDGTEDGSLDAAIAAITINGAREVRVDFSHPFYTTGYGIAVKPPSEAGLFGILSRLLSWQFLHVVGLLVMVLLVAGGLAWMFERRRNPEQFGSGLKGVGDGFWWSAVTMTTVGYGDKAPVTLGGRIVALVWMFAAIIIISSFTAGITSALTVSRLSGTVQSVHDLPKVRVAAPGGSTAAAYLKELGVAHETYANSKEGLQAIASGWIDAFVSDASILRYLAKGEFSGSAHVLPETFGRQDYGIALPPGSPLREPLNRAILEVTSGADWRLLVQGYLGD